MRLRLHAISIAITAMLLTSSALAADPMAESMFQEALAMMREGRFAEARPKLEASQRLEKKSGTLLVLGSCSEQLGRTATAWAEYKEAAALARAEGRPEHAQKASELARSLEARLSKVRIELTHAGSESMTVIFNGQSVVEGALGVAFAVDPGKHSLDASAQGRRTLHIDVVIPPGAGETVVQVPELPMETAPPTGAPPPAPIVTRTTAPDRTPAPVWPWIVGGSGVVALAVGVGFAVDQQSAASELDDQCGVDRAGCPAGFDFESARGREERGQALFIGLGLVGLGAVTTGAIGLLTGREPRSSTGSVTGWAPRVTVGLGSVGATGTF
jgi:hypothetical protein